ncbi:hypothetical protein AKO1_001037 [Acrasis kona]|uniref:Uncharacterized protein n=1 Tax=Acrasis kona TaxID=1008807 RepID=A0AAW2ZCM0_9EUKA
MLGEKIFLFVWAVVSSTKDVFIDYTVELFDYITAAAKPERKKKLKQVSAQDRKRRAYFKRLRHQMGVYTPEKSKSVPLPEGDGDELDAIAANLQKVLGDDDKQSKLEDLESQLIELKQQMAFMTSGSKPSPQKHQLQPAPVKMEAQNQPPAMMNNHVEIAKNIPTAATNVPPPPPPPPPMNMPPKTKIILKQDLSASVPLRPSSPTSPTAPATGRIERSMSMADIVRSAKNHKLKPTDVHRSPNGTPAKKKGGNFQNELFAAIKNKFSTSSDSAQNSDNDSDSDSFDTPPRKSNTMNKENIAGKANRKPLQLHNK